MYNQIEKEEHKNGYILGEYEEKFFPDDKKRVISLIVTERCDLSCVYCYEHNKTSKQMVFAEAKKIIDEALVDLDEYYYSIDFFGGEPFLNFELIKEVTEYVLENYVGYYHFFATTNGTQIHGEVQNWLKKHKEVFTVGLSLDGTKEAHDINRSGSFDKIDLDFFLSTYPNQTVKMTVSEQSLPFLAKSIKFLSEKGFLIACNLAYMIDWLSPINAKILEEQLESIIQYYIDNPTIPRCSLMDFKIEMLSHPSDDQEKTSKYCGCGTHMSCYDIHGECYPCQLFAPLSAEEKAVKSIEFKISDALFKENFPLECQNCYYLRICPFCLGSNYLSTGNIYTPDKGRCELYKLIFKANAKLKALEWKNNLINTTDEQGLLRSIIHILDNDKD